MTDKSKSDPDDEEVVKFPQSRAKPVGHRASYRDLGLSKTAQAYEAVQPNVKGHWCSQCKGIWWGFVGEVECPKCGNRHG